MKTPVNYTLTFDGDERNEARILAGLDGCGGAFRELITINTADPVIRRHASVFFARLMSALHEIDALEAKLPEPGAKCGTCETCGGTREVLLRDFDAEDPIQPCPDCEAKCGTYGGSGEVEVPETICPGCAGSGEGQYEGTRCRSCGGSGEEIPAYMEPCPDCAKCPTCGGTGEVERHPPMYPQYTFTKPCPDCGEEDRDD